MENKSVENISLGTLLLQIIPGGILLGAVIMDLRTRKVSNRFVVAAFVLSLFVAIASGSFSSVWTALGSVMAACIIVLPIYLLRAIGGGDFKLIIAISPLLTWDSTLIVVAAAMVWGSILGVFSALTHGQIKNLGQNMLGIFTKNKPKLEHLHRIPFTVAILFGWVTLLIFQKFGMGIL